LNDCGVLLVIIGKGWLDIKDNSGKRRLDNSSDFVRFEIATALKREIRVIPVLFDNIEMPLKDYLTEDIHGLCDRHAISIDRINLKSDVERLAKVIKKTITPIITEQPLQDPLSPKEELIMPDPAPEKRESSPKIPTEKRWPQRTGIILSVIIGVLILLNSYLFFTSFSREMKYIEIIIRGNYMYMTITGVISILLCLGTWRITRYYLFVFCLILLIPLWWQLPFHVKHDNGGMFIANVLIELIFLYTIWAKKYKSALVTILISFAILTFSCFSVLIR
jgi:hypothetical protein